MEKPQNHFRQHRGVAHVQFKWGHESDGVDCCQHNALI